MSTYQEILAATNSLTNAERAELIAALWARLPSDEWPAPSEEWQREAQRRSTEIDAGRMDLTTWTDARARARRKAGLDG